MNIFGIGIDIIEINRIENVLERTPRFLERNFTEKEIDYFKQKNFKSESYFIVILLSYIIFISFSK